MRRFVFVFLSLLLVSSVQAQEAVMARDVLRSSNCAAATVSLPFCRQGAGATLESFCASGGTYGPCGSGSVSPYTDEMAQDAVGTILTDSATIDFTYSDPTPSMTAIVIDDAISNAKLRNSGALSVIGRSANSTGDPADISGTASSVHVLRVSGTALGFGTIDSTYISDFAEAAQDAVGGILTDTATIDFTYTDGGPTMEAAVISDTNIQRVEITKNSGAVVGTRKQLNFIEGANVTLTIADDSGNNQVDVTIAAGGGGCTVPGSDTQLIFNDGGACGADSALTFAKTLDILALGGAAVAGTSGAVVFTMYGPGNGTAVNPTAEVTDAAQLYVRDYAAGNASWAMRTEANNLYVFGRSLLQNTLILSPTMIQGHYIEQDGADDGALQLGSVLDVAHGMTSLGPTSMYADFRKILGASGGLQIRGFTEGLYGLFLSGIVTTEDTTKTTTADAAVIVEVGLKDTTSVQAMSANANLFAVQDRFGAGYTKLIVDKEGDLWISGGLTAVGSMIATPVAAQTIADTNTIAADSCGTVKRITSAGAVVTNTTNTFTAPSATNAGCVMVVCNVGANDITLDENTAFKATGDIVLGADDCVLVASTGASGSWFQVSAASAN